MIIQHNMAAMFTQRQLGITERGKTKATERLGSGYNVNRAADNAAGLSISEKMRGQIRGLEQASKNVQDGVSYVQVADGALNEIHSIMQRMRELAVQAANDTYVESDREAADAEVQQLKEQIDSILSQTEFNTRPIWDVNAEGKTLAGKVRKPAVTVIPSDTKSHAVPLTNQNKYKIANDANYTIHADENGMQLSWTDYYGEMHIVPENDADGNKQYVPWPEPDGMGHPDMPDEYYLPQKFSTNFADYMGEEDKKLGLNLPVAFSITEGSTVEDLVYCLDGTRLNQSEPTSFSIETDGRTQGISLGGGSFSGYKMFLALNSMDSDAGGNAIAGVDFSRRDDVFLESTATDNVTAPDIANMSGNWTMSFESPAYPGVQFTATSTNAVSYSVSSREEEHEDLWWETYVDSNGKRHQLGLTYNASGSSTLEAVNEALTNSLHNVLIHDEDNNGTGHSGSIRLTFELTAETPLSITNPDASTTSVGTDVGTFYLYINVGADDTIDDIKDKMASLQYLDIHSGSGTKTSYVSFSGPRTKEIDSPLWEAVNNLNIQAGANTEQNIRMTYDAIRTYSIGLTQTNVLTRNDADTAITEMDDAIEVISQQRSYFGAIQNRLEHAQLNADNMGENLQAAESGIRDADMAEEMVELSKRNILEQAAQAVLAQENKATEGILQLLQ